MGASNTKNQRKMGFWESSRGVVGGILGNLVLVGFGYLVAIPFLVISAGPMSVPPLSGSSHL